MLPLTAISAVMIATDKSTSNALPNSFDQTKWSGRASQFGAWYSLAGISGGSYILGKLTKNDRFRESGLLGLEALGHAQVIVFAVKQATNRQRPVDGDGEGRFWSGGTSFPSGHAMSSFAVATVFAHEFSDHPLVGIAAYGLAGTVAASRLSARRHWLSDIVVGGSAGWVIGHFTYQRNHKLKFPGGTGSSTSSAPSKVQRFIPQVGIGGTTFRLSWQL